MLLVSQNPILLALREHIAWDAEHGPEEDMELTPLEQWEHWLKWGDQEVTDDPAAIKLAEQVVFRLAAISRMR